MITQKSVPFLMAILALLVVPAHAANIVVNSTADNLTAGDGLCTVREGIQNANLAAGGDTTGGDCVAGAAGADVVLVPAGTYLLSLAGVNDDLNASGDLDIREPMDLRGDGAATTFLDGQALDRIVDVRTSGIVDITGLTLRNGNASQGGAMHIFSDPLVNVELIDVELRDNQAATGGALAILRGSIEMFQTKMIDNTATGQGGAIYAFPVSGAMSVYLEDSEIRGNQSQGVGGGITIHGGVLDTDLILSEVLLEDNTAAGPSGSGGALFTAGTVEVGLDESTFRGNFADQHGGAIYHDGEVLDIVGGIVELNEADGMGGGIWLGQNSGILATLSGVQIRQNQSNVTPTFIGDGGGGIRCETGDLLLVNSLVENNVATSGDGGGVSTHTTGSVEIRNSTVQGNSAGGYGGGLFVERSAFSLIDSVLQDNVTSFRGGGLNQAQSIFGSTTVSGSTIAGNQAVSGGGLAVFADFEMSHSTVSGNEATGNNGGGGINFGSFAVASLDFVTITANQVSSDTGKGGGLQFSPGAEVRLKNSIIADNVASGPDDCAIDAATVTSLGYNMDGDGTCSLGAGPGDAVAGVANLGPLQDNGGPGPTHAILFASDATDSADPGCLSIGGIVQTEDQRGAPRPMDGDGNASIACDIGAFEGPNAAPMIPPPVPDGTFGVAMRASRSDPAGTAVDVDWDVTLCTSADFHLIYGDLADVAAYAVSGGACGLGIDGIESGVALPAGDLWFLIVADDGNLIEGSWGDGTAGVRSGLTPSFTCGVTVRDDSGVCP